MKLNNNIRLIRLVVYDGLFGGGILSEVMFLQNKREQL